MATNMDEEIDEIVAHVDTKCTALLTDGHTNTSDTGNGRRGIPCRTRLVLLLHLVCLGYSLYLIWLLAHLKGNNYYWFLSFIPVFFNFLPFLVLCMTYHVLYDDDCLNLMAIPSYGVLVNLMACFTMLTRQAYYHRQPDEFIGPRFIIISLQGSIILILLDFVLQRIGKQESLLHYKDALIRMLLDFVDIFNMVEILSVNVCVGVGSYISEDSSTERAIQAFCTLSFMILFYGQPNIVDMVFQHDPEPRSSRTYGEVLYSVLTIISSLCQNLPFLVIRIVVWSQYKLYSLGFLVKNVTVTVLFIAVLVKVSKIRH